MKVLVFGSLNIDYVYKVKHFVQPGETLASDDMQIFCGGKGLNQSIAFCYTVLIHGMQEQLEGMIQICCFVS